MIHVLNMQKFLPTLEVYVLEQSHYLISIIHVLGYIRHV